jgi:DNA invertase Pin-like site-specific DNA recombinase
MLGVVAKLERRRIIEHAARGCVDAKASGVRFGRKPKLSQRRKKGARARLAERETQRGNTHSYNVSQATVSRLGNDAA